MVSSRTLAFSICILFLYSFIAEIDSLKCYEGTSSIVNNVIKVDASSNTCSKKYCMKQETKLSSSVTNATHSCTDSCTFSSTISGSITTTTTCSICDNCNPPNTTGILQCYRNDGANNNIGDKIMCAATDKFCSKSGAGSVGINMFVKGCLADCKESNFAGTGSYCCQSDFCNVSATNIAGKFVSAVALLFALLFV